MVAASVTTCRLTVCPPSWCIKNVHGSDMKKKKNVKWSQASLTWSCMPPCTTKLHPCRCAARLVELVSCTISGLVKGVRSQNASSRKGGEGPRSSSPSSVWLVRCRSGLRGSERRPLGVAAPSVCHQVRSAIMTAKPPAEPRPVIGGQRQNGIAYSIGFPQYECIRSLSSSCFNPCSDHGTVRQGVTKKLDNPAPFCVPAVNSGPSSTTILADDASP